MKAEMMLLIVIQTNVKLNGFLLPIGLETIHEKHPVDKSSPICIKNAFNLTFV